MLIHDFVDGQYFLEGTTASEKRQKKKKALSNFRPVITELLYGLDIKT
jgi:hypothetical protein